MRGSREGSTRQRERKREKGKMKTTSLERKKTHFQLQSPIERERKMGSSSDGDEVAVRAAPSDRSPRLLRRRLRGREDEIPVPSPPKEKDVGRSAATIDGGEGKKLLNLVSRALTAALLVRERRSPLFFPCSSFSFLLLIVNQKRVKQKPGRPRRDRAPVFLFFFSFFFAASPGR